MTDLFSALYKLLIEPLAAELQRAAQGVVDEASVRRGRDWVEAAQREFPLASAFIDSLINSEPAAVMRDLTRMAKPYGIDLKGLKGNKHVLNYIREVQVRVRGSEFRVPSSESALTTRQDEFNIQEAIRYFLTHPNSTDFHIPMAPGCKVERRQAMHRNSSIARLIKYGQIIAEVEFQDRK